MLYTELGLVFILTLINGALAMSEMAVVSSRPARLRALLERGVGGAAQAIALAAEPGRFLSTVQIGITLVGVLSGAYSGATLGERLAAFLASQGVAKDYASLLGVGGVVTAITYLSLIIGELVPKQLALKNPERLACAVAPAMRLLSTVAFPVVWLLEKSGALVLALIGQNRETDQRITEEEIKTIISEAESAGVLEAGERKMISAVMRLGDRPARSIMTPRHDVDMIALTTPLPEIIRQIADSPHSRIPVFEVGADGNIVILGVIYAADLVGAAPPSTDALRKLIRQAPIVPETLDALDIVETLRKSSVHIGLVHDEFGHFVGVVTPSDILESIVGVFASEGEATEEAIVRRADGSLLIAGWTPIEDLAETLGLTLQTKELYSTAAGWIVHAFGKLPAVGEQVFVEQWLFEVVDLDGRRIDKLLATHRPLDPRGHALAR